MRVPLSETFVRYEEGDLLGLGLAILTLMPVYIAVIYATACLLRRDLQTAFMLAGSILCVILNLILKRLIAQPRPIGQTDLDDYGMPSSHAQFTVCFATMIALQLLAVPSSQLPVALKAIYVTGIYTVAIAVCLSRVYLRYHTTLQVLVGAAVGFILGYQWYRLMISQPIKRLFRYLAALPLARWLLVRNYETCDWSIYAEYAATQDPTFRHPMAPRPKPSAATATATATVTTTNQAQAQAMHRAKRDS